MSKDTKGLIIFVFVIIIGLFAAAENMFAPSYGIRVNEESEVVSGNSNLFTTKVIRGNYIAKVNLEGTIQPANSTYNQRWIISTVRKLRNDPDNLGLILYINSPGGTVYEADELYLELMKYKASGKPIYAYMGSLAASGGYYAACAADKIYANRNTLTGSIGVIAGTYIDITELMSSLGINSTTIYSGDNKNMGNYNEELDYEQQEILQTLVDECYEQFTGIVAERRNLPLDEVQKLADGRIYTAKQASKNGLIDKVDSYENFVTDFRNNAVKETAPIITFRYEKEHSLYETLLGVFTKVTKTAVESAAGPKFTAPAFYYTGM